MYFSSENEQNEVFQENWPSQHIMTEVRKALNIHRENWHHPQTHNR